MSDFNGIPWLLATGQGRSGTTVLTRALAAHPRICSNRVESNVLKDVLLAGHASCTMPSRQRQMVLSRSDHDEAFRRFVTGLLFPARLWSEPEEPPAALSTFSAMNPDAADYAATILPGIHFANIVRNGVEVVASRMVHHTLGQHTFDEHCIAWAAAAEMVQWGSGRDDFTLIRHEDLLDADCCRRAFGRLLERAGLPHDERCANYVLETRRNQTTWTHESPGESGTLERRVDRWRHWTDEQRETFRRICGAAMDYFGYRMPG
jgi:hypothetical protein